MSEIRTLVLKADVFYQTFLTPVELTSALYRRFRQREINSEELALMLRAYVAHSHEDYLLLPYSEALMERATSLLAHHALRALDAIQLASALELKERLPVDELPVTFISADERLVEAARQEHLVAKNPERWS